LKKIDDTRGELLKKMEQEFIGNGLSPADAKNRAIDEVDDIISEQKQIVEDQFQQSEELAAQVLEDAKKDFAARLEELKLKEDDETITLR
jgi:UTP-glucose-1-phosphate uridylyltransferase